MMRRIRSTSRLMRQRRTDRRAIAQARQTPEDGGLRAGAAEALGLEVEDFRRRSWAWFAGMP